MAGAMESAMITIQGFSLEEKHVVHPASQVRSIHMLAEIAAWRPRRL